MIRKQRRYQALGLMRRSHHTDGAPLEGVNKFVTESQWKDEILLNRVSRARPTVTKLVFPEDDVDWKLEYVCGVMGRWMKRCFEWLVGVLGICIRFVGFRRKRREEEEDDTAGHPGGGGDAINKSLCDRNYFSTGQIHRKIADVYPERTWRYENCIPFLNRRIVKRKWFLNPRTRAWADERVELFQNQATRGFRTLCSGIGKDIKIFVTCLPSETAQDSFSNDSVPQIYIFRADSSVLRSHSHQFKQWFTDYGNEKEKRIMTKFVTPQEVQAILVYMYTHTWPTSVMVQREGRGATLDPRILEVFGIYGIPMKIKREIPPGALRKKKISSNTSLLEEKLPTRNKDVNRNRIVLNEVSTRSRIEGFNDPVIPPTQQVPSSPQCRRRRSALGEGDCSNVQMQQTEIMHYVTEISSPINTEPVIPTPISSSSSDRSVTKRKFDKGRQFLKASLNRHRVHPETVLVTYPPRSRLKPMKRTRRVGEQTSAIKETLEIP